MTPRRLAIAVVIIAVLLVAAYLVLYAFWIGSLYPGPTPSHSASAQALSN